MLQALCGMVTVRVPPAGIAGPPKLPFARRVSMMRHGVTGMNCRPELAVAEKFAVRVVGALIVTLVEALVLLATLPVQLTKVNPLLAAAVIGTTVLAS